MADEKNRFGDELNKIGSAKLGEWAAKSDRALIERLRREAEERIEKERREKRKPRAFNRILCATDFGKWSLTALNLAKQIALENEAQLYVAHICPTVTIPLGGKVTGTPEAEAAARTQLEEVAAKRLAGIPHELIIVTGDPADRIIQLQATLLVDLIVLGTQGRSGVPRFFLGSVADRVVRAAACPVLTIRGK